MPSGLKRFQNAETLAGGPGAGEAKRASPQRMAAPGASPLGTREATQLNRPG